MSDFDYFTFYELTDELEKYLGSLKGNELVREYDDLVLAESKDVLFVQWETPDPEYPCLYLGLAVPYDADDPDNGDVYAETVKQMEKNWAEAFGNGAKWAEGLGAYFRSLCADLATPNADMIRSSVQDFGDTAAALESVIPVDWTDLDFNSWIGESSDACQRVVDNFQAKFRDEYAFYFTYAQAIYAGAGAVVLQSQKGLNKTLEVVRDITKSQLAAWQETGGHQPQDLPETPDWVADVGKIVGGVMDLIPGVSTVKGKLEDLAGIAEGVLGLLDKDVTWKNPGFDAMTAEQVCTKTTTTLQDDYMKAMRDGLDRLQSERANAVVSAQEGISPWLMDTLDGIDSEPWEHEAEA